MIPVNILTSSFHSQIYAKYFCIIQIIQKMYVFSHLLSGSGLRAGQILRFLTSSAAQGLTHVKILEEN